MSQFQNINTKTFFWGSFPQRWDISISLSQAVCSPIWDSASCLPPTLIYELFEMITTMAVIRKKKTMILRWTSLLKTFWSLRQFVLPSGTEHHAYLPPSPGTALSSLAWPSMTGSSTHLNVRFCLNSFQWTLYFPEYHNFFHTCALTWLNSLLL